MDAEMKELLRRIERMEAVNEIQNVMARYVNLHCASRQDETCELFCHHTEGTWCCFSGDVFNGYEGVENHFKGFMREAEQDLTGRLYLHDIVSPLIEVSGDGQTAKAIFGTMGCETGIDEDFHPMSLWSFDRYRIDFHKEDGKWKIWHMDFHPTFLTPFDGKGWTHEPYYDIGANMMKKMALEGIDFSRQDDGANAGPDKFVSYRLPERYKPFSITEVSCDIHDQIPAVFGPYDTWDEPIGPPGGGPAIM